MKITQSNRKFCLVSRPLKLPKDTDFAVVESAVPNPHNGEFLIRNEYASIDPAIRRRLDDATSYIDAVEPGQAVATTTVGRIVASRADSVAVGDWYTGMHGIETYSIGRTGGLTRKLDVRSNEPLTVHLTKYGPVGLTAWLGLHEIAHVRAGETILVSAAAGGVGSLVGQLARQARGTTIGIAGGADKCRRLIERYGYDHAIDYRGRSRNDMVREIATRAPAGVDVLFENVGGIIMEAGLETLAPHSRVALCGMIADYNLGSLRHGVDLRPLLASRAEIRGFIMADYIPAYADAISAMRSIPDLKVDEHIFHGLEQAYAALSAMFDGSATGKVLLKID